VTATISPFGEIPLSFVTCVADNAILRANLLASPCLQPGSPPEAILVKNCPSAATGLNLGLERAKHEWVVLAHQDVFLPMGWERLIMRQLAEAERRLGPIGIAGVYGVGEVLGSQSPGRALAARRVGWVVPPEADLRRSRAAAARRTRAAGAGCNARRAAPDRAARYAAAVRPGAGVSPVWGGYLPARGGSSTSWRRNGDWRSWCWGRCAITIPGALGCRGHSLRARRSSRHRRIFDARKWAHRLPVATPCVIPPEADLRH
jgi:hypothetical protein